MDLAGIEPGTL